MPDDLNDFLRQAALRREARKKAGGAPSTQAKPTANPNVNQPSVRPIRPAEDADIIEPIPIEQRHLTPHIPPPEHLAGNVAKTDQKREAHLKEKFGHTPVPLERQQKKKTKSKGEQKSQVPTIATQANSAMDSLYAISESKSEPASNYKVMSPQDLLKLLRNPDSLKMAFIASEIFGRKFQ